MTINNELWNLVCKNNYLSYECHDEIVYRAERAIELKDPTILFGSMSLFKPDDASDPTRNLEHHTAEDVYRYMIDLGIKDYVVRKIAENG